VGVRIQALPVIIGHGINKSELHFILKSLKPEMAAKVRLTCKTAEEIVSLKINGVRFLDPKQFLNYDLSMLISRQRMGCLPNQLVSRFPLLYEKYGNNPSFASLLDTMLFPIKFLVTSKPLEFPTFPEYEYFVDPFTNQIPPELYYEGSCSVYRNFNCNNFSEYMRLYLTRNILCLADIVTFFNSFLFKHFRLSMLHSCTLSSYAYGACFSSVENPFQYIKDIEIIRYLQNAVRSGPCMSVIRKIVANTERLMFGNKLPVINFDGL
jgi:hypothetical protein